VKEKTVPVPMTPVPTPSQRARLSWGAAAGLTVVLGYLLILVHNSAFFFQDDTEAGAVPNWLFIGDRLHRGGVPILTPDAWMGGNWTVEGQNSLWNPVQLAIDYVAPMVDRIDLFAAGVKGCASSAPTTRVHGPWAAPASACPSPTRWSRRTADRAR
jgi:hypothetical protein